ncbi:type I restriction enzyme, M subunit [Fibrella aestuarina BUZ 2]|uniref:site-specific DNA-methyltransferase (adenine-specific) n=1 Tax=Fibrella aestuarina BUZ 2 TaxID=1166018 RepID=I0KD50_9BACT|nr:N-6 DNA methylase [Fibrella aestuarina]CCH02053.1 type I restriction enzyme, M subunit [Fibrella aestuarina BUZ 2]
MPKSTDVPPELRSLNKVFSQLDYKWDYADSFRDFVDFLTESFMPVRQGEYERLQKKHGSLNWFVDMTREWVLVQDKMIAVDGTGGWYDALGTFYETLASRGKKSSLGQFFTPPEVCEVMVRINGFTTDMTGKGLSIQDPASGSGRMLLAAHVTAPGNYQYAADLDPICTKMAAANMCLHGCVGQAVCMDSLNPDDWRFGYAINRSLAWTGVPTIEPIQKEQCRAWNLAQQQKADEAARQAAPTTAPVPAPAVPKTARIDTPVRPQPEPTNAGKFGQLKLF